MKTRLAFVAAAAALSLAAQADTVLAPGSAWEYSFLVPVAGWETGAGGSWAVGNAPFGNTGSGDFGAATGWPAGAELWVRRQVDLSGYNLNTVTWDLGVDNGYMLYVNGALVSAANAEGFTFRWEYSGALAAGQLVAGNNWVAVALEDHGGATAFDMQVSARPVPEPGTYALMLAGLAAVAGLARRRRPA